MFKKVWVTPDIEKYLSDAIDPETHNDAYKWLCYVREELWYEWENLREGSHLKDAYRDDVWSWNDEDLV